MELATLEESQTLYRKHALHGERQIRVLDLEPSETFETPLRASMRVLQIPELKFEVVGSNKRRRLLSDRLAYQTLSYAWGQPTMTSAIFIDGLRTPVTPHLEAGLKRIREKLRPADIFMPTLWVDAICINQNDVNEQAQQVMIMGDVYTLAKRLIIWLGEAVQDQTESYQSSSPDKVKECLVKLVDNPYFRRRWVLQEVFLSQLGARHVLHGGTRKRLESLMNHVNIHVPPKLLNEVAILKRNDFYHSPATQRSKLPLSILMIRYRNSECQRPHDRFFALLGLCEREGTGHQQYRVDYTMQIDDLNREIARAEILGDARSVLVCATFTRRTKSSSDASPSWVPNWQQVRAPVNESHRRVLRELDDGPYYPPNSSVQPSVVLNQQRDVLDVEGWIFQPCNHQLGERDCLCCFIFERQWRFGQEEGPPLRSELRELALTPQEQVLLIDGSECLFIITPRVNEENEHPAYALEYALTYKSRQLGESRVGESAGSFMRKTWPAQKIQIV